VYFTYQPLGFPIAFNKLLLKSFLINSYKILSMFCVLELCTCTHLFHHKPVYLSALNLECVPLWWRSPTILLPVQWTKYSRWNNRLKTPLSNFMLWQTRSSEVDNLWEHPRKRRRCCSQSVTSVARKLLRNFEERVLHFPPFQETSSDSENWCRVTAWNGS
jgi:hypothetical protein